MRRLEPSILGSGGALAALLVSWAMAGAGCGPSYPKCDNDQDCHLHEFCVNGQCQMCRTNADCPTGQACDSGRCDPIPGFCQGSGDCPHGQQCQNNRCITPVQSTEDIPAPTPPSEDNGPCQVSPVYFAFDSDALDTGSRNTLESDAQCINQRGFAHVHLTGYTDPRGTEEYNLALGDRRARSVMKYLTSMGVGSGKLTTSSMGEEMAQGTDESSWYHDRRVEMTTQQ